MIVELKKSRRSFCQRTYYGSIDYYDKDVLCSKFVRKILGSTRGVDRIKLYVTSRDTKDPSFIKAKLHEAGISINDTNRPHYIYSAVSDWLSANGYMYGDEFWFKIEPVK